MQHSSNLLIRLCFSKRPDPLGCTQLNLDRAVFSLNQRSRTNLAVETCRLDFGPMLRRPIETTRLTGTWPGDLLRYEPFPCCAALLCSQALLPCMRAFLLATSAGQRARLMLPTGALSGVELPVTSIYSAWASSGFSSEFRRSVSRPIVWNGASASSHSTLAFSIQKLASRRLPQ